MHNKLYFSDAVNCSNIKMIIFYSLYLQYYIYNLSSEYASKVHARDHIRSVSCSTWLSVHTVHARLVSTATVALV